MEALNENCFGDRPVRRFKQRHHCDGAALCGPARRRGHEVVILAGGAPCEGKICAPVHRIPVFQKLIESQGMCFAKPDEEAYYTAFKDARYRALLYAVPLLPPGERNWPRQMGIPTVAAFHVQPENITSSIFLGKNRRVNDFLYWWFYKVFTTGSTISTVPALLSPGSWRAMATARSCGSSPTVLRTRFVPRRCRAHRSWREGSRF